MLSKKDLHIHATAYNAFPTKGNAVTNIVDKCIKIGLDYAGILEHFNGNDKHPDHFVEKLIADFRALKLSDNFFTGVEADLKSDGSDSCGIEKRSKLDLDYVIGSVHLGTQHFCRIEDYIEEEFKRICLALETNKVIDIIGHPWVQGIRWERNGIIPYWDFGMVPESYQDRIIDLALINNIAIEVNNLQEIIERDINYMKFIGKLHKSKVKISVGSDAHKKDDIKHSITRTKMLEEIGFKDEQIWIPNMRTVIIDKHFTVAQ